MYRKIHQSILSSSIAANTPLRRFFTDLLLVADAAGEVNMTPEAIARQLNTTLDEVQWGLAELQKPDAKSRNPEFEGRRIEPLEGLGFGWRILNFDLYMRMRDPEERRAKDRERSKRYRQRHAASRSVTQRHGTSQKIHHGDGDGDGDGDGRKRGCSGGSIDPPPQPAVASSGGKGKGNGRVREMPGAAGEVLRAFDSGHRAQHGGTPYLAAFGRDLKVLRDPLKVYGLPRMLDFVAAFWDEVHKARRHPDDPKYAAGRAKPNIPGLIGQIPNLIRRYRFDSPLPLEAP